MTTPHGPADPPEDRHADASESLRAFAETIELSFLDIQRSLTEPDTAAVFLRTLDLWERALEGSRANGVITSDQLTELTEVMDGMRQAPRLI
jgi:hypothetical protein